MVPMCPGGLEIWLSSLDVHRRCPCRSVFLGKQSPYCFVDAICHIRLMVDPPDISLVVPVYDEEVVLPAFMARARAALELTDLSWEIIFADDGSRDATAEVIRAYHKQDPRIGLISLSRNFGKDIAMTAGVDHARGRAVVVIDADLQDPPEVIADLIARWEDGYDVVYARRVAREGETTLKKMTAHMFYRVINNLADQPIPTDVGDFD